MLYQTFRFIYHVIRVFIWLVATLVISPLLIWIVGKDVINAIEDTCFLFVSALWSFFLACYVLDYLEVFSNEIYRVGIGSSDLQAIFFSLAIPLCITGRVKPSREGRYYFANNTLLKINYDFKVRSDFRFFS